MYDRGESGFSGTRRSTKFWFVKARASRTSDAVRPTLASPGAKVGGGGLALGFFFPMQAQSPSGSGSPGGGGAFSNGWPTHVMAPSRTCWSHCLAKVRGSRILTHFTRFSPYNGHRRASVSASRHRCLLRSLFCGLRRRPVFGRRAGAGASELRIFRRKGAD